MVAQFTTSRSVLVDLLNDLIPNPEDAGPHGPVLRRVPEVVDVHRVPGGGSFPQPWRDIASLLPGPWLGLVAATATIRYTLDRQQMAELVGAGDQANESARAAIERFVDDIRGRPPRLRWSSNSGASASLALRALLPGQTTLSNAEQHLLGEWLDRLTAD